MEPSTPRATHPAPDRAPDVLRDGGGHAPRRLPEVPAEPGLLAEVDGFVGTVTAVTPTRVTLTDRRDRARHFALGEGVAYVDDEPVVLVAPAAAARPAATAAAPRTTASGSIAIPDATARVARASRIWVEGVHDAELLERVWGDDLRVAGIVVEPLDGADDLAAHVRAFAPGPTRRLAVLLDHLVPGSKESRIAAGVRHPHVLVTGHPYVDVWAAVKPARLGLDAWPDVPRGVPWKEGLVAALGWGDVHDAWRRVRGSVTRLTDLERPLVGAVEACIDFVTVGGPQGGEDVLA
ncbi:MAG: DUF3097 family protein [Actinomycetes bacterium]